MSYESKFRQPHPSFEQPDQGFIPVWRYMDLPKFISLLQAQTLYFSRLDKLADSFEGSITRPLSEAWARTLNKHDPSLVTQVSNFRRQNLRSVVFVNCWHAGRHESEAMWMLYCGKRDGIAIQTTYEKLDASLSANIHLGLVHYIDYETDVQDDSGNFMSALMCKRLAFQHEHEVRAVLLEPTVADHKWIETPSDKLGVKVSWDSVSCLEGIYIHPSADEWFAEVVRAVVDKFTPALSGRIRWSQMKSEPLF